MTKPLFKMSRTFSSLVLCVGFRRIDASILQRKSFSSETIAFNRGRFNLEDDSRAQTPPIFFCAYKGTLESIRNDILLNKDAFGKRADG